MSMVIPVVLLAPAVLPVVQLVVLAKLSIVAVVLIVPVSSIMNMNTSSSTTILPIYCILLLFLL